MLEQYDEMLPLYGTQTGVNLARKHIGWYTKGLPGSAELRNKVNQQDDPAVVVRDVAGILFPVARALGGLNEIPRKRVCFSCNGRARGPSEWMRLRPTCR